MLFDDVRGWQKMKTKFQIGDRVRVYGNGY